MNNNWDCNLDYIQNRTVSKVNKKLINLLSIDYVQKRAIFSRIGLNSKTYLITVCNIYDIYIVHI